VTGGSMINESFINDCYSLCFNKFSMIKKTKKMYLEIDTLINEYGIVNKDSFPIGVSNKIGLFQTMLSEAIQGNTIEQIITNINWSGRYKELKDFVEFKLSEMIDENRMEKINFNISVSRNSILLMKEKVKLQEIFKKCDDGVFDTYHEINQLCFDGIIEFHNKIQEAKRAEILNSGGSFSLGEKDIDDTNLDAVLNMLVEVNDPSNKIPTGFGLIDNDILNGGFAKKAVYVFAGATKSGKSTFINNILFNAAQVEYDGRKKLFIYISLENLPHEALQRSACKVLNVKPEVIYDKAKNHRTDFKNELNEYVLRYNNAISFDYKASQSISVMDLYPYIDSKLDDYNDKIGEIELGAIYIDYLNHLKGVGKKDLRLQLGDLVQALKTLAIDYDCPVITATQLNRESLRVKNSRELHIGMVAESHVISGNSDGVFLLARDPDNDNLVHFNSGVQRGGKSQRALDFNVDFDKLSFINSIEPDGNNNNIETGDMVIPSGCKINGIENTKQATRKPKDFGGMGELF
jgi:hypothetical protein